MRIPVTKELTWMQYRSGRWASGFYHVTQPSFYLMAATVLFPDKYWNIIFKTVVTIACIPVTVLTVLVYCLLHSHNLAPEVGNGSNLSLLLRKLRFTAIRISRKANSLDIEEPGIQSKLFYSKTLTYHKSVGSVISLVGKESVFKRYLILLFKTCPLHIEN